MKTLRVQHNLNEKPDLEEAIFAGDGEGADHEDDHADLEGNRDAAHEYLRSIKPETMNALDRATETLSGEGTSTTLLQMGKPGHELTLLWTDVAVQEATNLMPAEHQPFPKQLPMLPSYTADPAEFYDQKAQKKENLELAESSLAEDDKFPADPKVRCINLDAEFEQHTKTQQQETKGVTKGLQFLNSDESIDKEVEDLINKSDVLAKTQAALTEASEVEATSGDTKSNIGSMSGAFDSLMKGLSAAPHQTSVGSMLRNIIAHSPAARPSQWSLLLPFLECGSTEAGGTDTIIGIVEQVKEIQKMISDVNDDGSGMIEHEESLKIVTHKILNRDSEGEIQKTFRLFNDDVTGKISVKNLNRVNT